MTENICKNCGKNYITPNKISKYCSKNCSIKYNYNKNKYKIRLQFKQYKLKNTANCPLCKKIKPIIYLINNIKCCESCYQKELYGRKDSRRKKKCLSHANNFNRSFKEKLIKYYGKKECVRCKVLNLPSCCYDFHHKEPSTKLFNLTGNNLKRSNKSDWVKFKEEVDKCDLLCANCHRIITADKNDKYYLQKESVCPNPNK